MQINIIKYRTLLILKILGLFWFFEFQSFFFFFLSFFILTHLFIFVWLLSALWVCLKSTYFTETENILLKVL